uniref:Zinc finger, C2H2 type n=1 Tax=Enterobius vermicularis TaxID=51028 RepID=A0A0N4VG89_ENTVE
LCAAKKLFLWKFSKLILILQLFPSKNHVEEHEAVVHQGTSTTTVPFGKFVCQFCNEVCFCFNKMSYNQDRLTKHIASRHRNPIEEAQKAHKCGVCGKGFARTDMLSRHMRLHKGDKPFACTVCGQEFSRSDHLTTHMRTHSGEKPYRCPFCCYAASRRDMMNRHLKTHSKSPEHVKAQETRMNIEGRSCSLSPNPGTTVTNSAANVLLNSIFPNSPVASQNRFLVPQPIPQFPTYFPSDLTPSALSRKPLNCPPVVLPNENCFLTPSSSEPALSQQQVSFQQLVGPLSHIVLPAQRSKLGIANLPTSSQQLPASVTNASSGTLKTESLSSVHLNAMTQASAPNINLLTTPVKTEISFDCSL